MGGYPLASWSLSLPLTFGLVAASAGVDVPFSPPLSFLKNPVALRLAYVESYEAPVGELEYGDRILSGRFKKTYSLAYRIVMQIKTTALSRQPSLVSFATRHNSPRDELHQFAI
jgi:hypothetical protein